MLRTPPPKQISVHALDHKQRRYFPDWQTHNSTFKSLRYCKRHNKGNFKLEVLFKEDNVMIGATLAWVEYDFNVMV